MNKHKYITTVLIWTVFLELTGCSNHKNENFVADKIITNSSSTISQQTNPDTTANLTITENELTKIYTQAIAEFIKAAYQKDRKTFDTLYFGKHIYGQADDFPNIKLPEIIEKTQIRLVTPEVGQKKQREQKSLIYVNMMGWVDKKLAEFLFVVFSNGAEHQYDYFIQFIYNTTTNKFKLDKIEFENYLHINEQKTKRITIYQDGKYVANN